MKPNILQQTLIELFTDYPYAEDFFHACGLEAYLENKKTCGELFYLLPESVLEDLGITPQRLCENLLLFIEQMEGLKTKKELVQEITIIGGVNKNGEKEQVELSIQRGNIIAVVGPTGSGKSRLLADIECLAQRDTQTKRQILVNGKIPDKHQRFRLENKLIAQLSQNMNFVMDLPVWEFLKLHGESRMIQNLEETCYEILYQANELAGERFSKQTPLTALSGGQSRALMIADTALLSASPIVLIDEIENAGVDRKRALQMLIKNEKIVLMSTHDPMLALMGDKRIMIDGGGITGVLEITPGEKKNLEVLERMDEIFMLFRDRLRSGASMEEAIPRF